MNTNCIGNAVLPISELQKVVDRDGDDFITVKMQGGNRDYVLESNGHAKNYNDSPM